MKLRRSAFGSLNFDKTRGLIGVVFWCVAIMGSAYLSVRAIQQGYFLIRYYQDIAANSDRISLLLGTIEIISVRDAGVIAGWFTVGFILLGWSIYLVARTIPILFEWLQGRQELESLPSQMAQNFGPLFKFAGMIALFAIAGGCYFFAITDAVPSTIRDFSPRNLPSVSQGEIVGTAAIVLFGTIALAGGVYLTLRLIVDAVKSFLRSNGVL